MFENQGTVSKDVSAQKTNPNRLCITVNVFILICCGASLILDVHTDKSYTAAMHGYTNKTSMLIDLSMN